MKTVLVHLKHLSDHAETMSDVLAINRISMNEEFSFGEVLVGIKSKIKRTTWNNVEIYTFNLIIFTCLCLHLYTDTYHKGRINTTYKVEPEINRNI